MRGLLSKTELRELEIIEFLAVQSDYVTINTLANKIHYSSRTIQSDLKTLSNYESYFTLHTTNAGVRLVFKKSTSIENIYYDFVKNSDSFRLLNLLFLNPKITINELVSELFISKSSLLIIRKMRIRFCKAIMVLRLTNHFI
ncbi:helix-turn-helix domain-containing protein [Streptococcus uberis]